MTPAPNSSVSDSVQNDTFWMPNANTISYEISSHFFCTEKIFQKSIFIVIPSGIFRISSTLSNERNRKILSDIVESHRHCSLCSFEICAEQITHTSRMVDTVAIARFVFVMLSIIIIIHTHRTRPVDQTSLSCWLQPNLGLAIRLQSIPLSFHCGHFIYVKRWYIYIGIYIAYSLADYTHCISLWTYNTRPYSLRGGISLIIHNT